MRFAGKSALVTGAARGIGRAIAGALAREGAAVAACDIDAAGAAAAAAEIHGMPFAMDVSDPAQVEAAVAATIREFGRLDVLVNNAGIGYAKLFLDTTLEEWEQVLRVNLTGPFLCAQAAARVMVRQGGGAIVNIGSISGQRGGTGRGLWRGEGGRDPVDARNGGGTCAARHSRELRFAGTHGNRPGARMP